MVFSLELKKLNVHFNHNQKSINAVLACVRLITNEQFVRKRLFPTFVLKEIIQIFNSKNVLNIYTILMLQKIDL